MIIDVDKQEKFVYPQSGDKLTLVPGQALTVSCPGFGNFLKDFGHPAYHQETFTCVKDTTFKLKDKEYNFMNLNCDKPPAFEVEEDKNFKHPKYRKFKIGFPTSWGWGFLTTVDAYYEGDKFQTKFVKSHIPHAIEGKQSSPKSRRFQVDGADEGLKEYYDSENQVKELGKQLNCAKLPKTDPKSCEDKYLAGDKKRELYFSRGHLAPKSHFVYEIAGASTFFYLNVGPQYQVINNNNWGAIEEFVPKLAVDKKKNLVVYTGSHGQLKLPDTADGNKEKGIYLRVNDNGEKIIPVPLYFWKLIYDRDNKHGSVLVTVNNPFLLDPESYKACKEPIKSLPHAKMPKWSNAQKNLKWGYSYMCKVDDFLSTTGVDIVDKLEVKDLLIYEK